MRALFMAGFGVAAAVTTLAAGCAAVLGVDDVGYGASEDAATDGLAADGTTADGALADAPFADVDGGADADGGRLRPEGSCTPDGALLFADFDESNLVTNGYVQGLFGAPFSQAGGSLDVDRDASRSAPASLVAEGAFAFLYVKVPPAWLAEGVSLEGDVRVELDAATASTKADLMALQFAPMNDAGIFATATSRASLSGEVADASVALQLLVTSSASGDVAMNVGVFPLGTWVHARMSVTPVDGGDFDVRLAVETTQTAGSLRVRGDAVGYVGWGVDRKTAFVNWRAHVDNACIRY